MQLHNEIPATLYMHRKVSHGVPLNLRTLLSAVWLGLRLHFESGRLHFGTCTQYVTNLIWSFCRCIGQISVLWQTLENFVF